MRHHGTPPLSIEVACGQRLENVTDDLRGYLRALGHLTADALLASSTIEKCADIFNKELWETGVGVNSGQKRRFSRLEARRWTRSLRTATCVG